MQTVRRLYLYLMSGISLGVLLVGLNILLTVVLHALGIGRGEFVGGSESDRQALSLAAALVVVGLLVWAVHWLLVERSLRPQNPNREAERGAGERALYFTVVLAVLLVFGVLAGTQLVEELTTRLFGVPRQDQFFASDLGASLATVVVTGSAWAYHVAIRQRDLRAGPLSGAGAWMPRVYLYGAALAGLILTALNVSTLLGSGVLALGGRVPDFDDGDFRERQAAIAIAGIMAWGIVWLGHWWFSTRLTQGTGWRAESERRARLRVAYFVAAVGSMALATAIFAFLALFGTLRLAFGAQDPSGSQDALEAIAVPLVSVLPWAAAWWLHRTWLFAEARDAADPARLATAERLNAAVVALIGLGALAGGLAGLLGLLLDGLLGGNRTLGDFWEAELAGYVAAAAIGAALWLWNWLRLQARHAAAPREEADSTVRRAYLLIVVGSTVITSLGSLAFVLYRLFASILEVDIVDNAASVLSAPLGALIVAAAAAIYHGLALRRDQALRAEAARAEPMGGAVAEAPAIPAAAPAPARRVLVLSGASDADLDATVAAIRAALPPELSLHSSPSED
jgi:Domain of unknown function (DUF5671)